MSTVVALAGSGELDGFGLVGVNVIATPTPASVLAAWEGLDDHVGLVILSPTAAATLGPRLSERPDVLSVTTP